MTKNKKKFAIAEILNEYNLIINCGEEEGVQIGNTFKIKGFSNKEILDPITDEILGYIPFNKGTGVVVEVYDNFSICKNNEVDGNNLYKSITNSLDNLPKLFGTSSKAFEIYENASVDFTNIEFDSNIKIGDRIFFTKHLK